MKKIILSTLISTLMTISTCAYASADDVTIKFNNELLELDTKAYIKNDCTMVPIRGIFEKAAGASVNWDQETKTVMIAQNKGEEFNFIFLQIDTENAFVNSESVKLDAPPEIKNDRTMVPLRFVMEQLGCKVTWDQETYTVNIVSE